MKQKETTTVPQRYVVEVRVIDSDWEPDVYESPNPFLSIAVGDFVILDVHHPHRRVRVRDVEHVIMKNADGLVEEHKVIVRGDEIRPFVLDHAVREGPLSPGRS